MEIELFDGSNADMDNSAFVVFDNEQSKEEYEEEMNKVDHEPTPGPAVSDCYSRRHGLCYGVAHLFSTVFQCVMKDS
eukprot:13457420-Ditylum_brightwellii.AAC.1